MLFDDVMLLLNDYVGSVVRDAATACAGIWSKRVFFGLKM
jgi:hypothetical protein